MFFWKKIIISPKTLRIKKDSLRWKRQFIALCTCKRMCEKSCTSLWQGGRIQRKSIKRISATLTLIILHQFCLLGGCFTVVIMAAATPHPDFDEQLLALWNKLQKCVERWLVVHWYSCPHLPLCILWNVLLLLPDVGMVRSMFFSSGEIYQKTNAMHWSKM